MNETPQPRTPGEILAEARADQGLSLEQVAERTKIPAPMLVAIERDEYHRISGPLYVRSFLRTYAGEVGVDPDEILDIYGRACGDSPRDSDAGQAQVWRDAEVKVERIGLPWLRIAGIVLAVIVVIGLIVALTLKYGADDGPRSSRRSTVPAVSTLQGQVPQRRLARAPDGRRWPANPVYLQPAGASHGSVPTEGAF